MIPEGKQAVSSPVRMSIIPSRARGSQEKGFAKPRGRIRPEKGKAVWIFRLPYGILEKSRDADASPAGGGGLRAGI